MVVLSLISIAVLSVFVIDKSGILNSINRYIFRKLYKNKRFEYQNFIPKPFSCSLCMTWWLSIIFLLISGNMTIPFLGLTGILSYLTTGIGAILDGANDLLVAGFEKIIKLISK